MQFLVQRGFKVQYLFSRGFRTKLKVIGLRVLVWFQTPILRVQIHGEASARMPWGFWWEQVNTSTYLSGAAEIGVEGEWRGVGAEPCHCTSPSLLMMAAWPWPLMVQPVAWQPVTLQ